jgi:hypothetical protein
MNSYTVCTFSSASNAPEQQMKSLILAIAAGGMLSSVAMATRFSSNQDWQDRGSMMVEGVVQQTNTAMKLAMGPTSAAHLPGGPVNQSSGMNSKCAQPSDSCHNLRKNAKYRHKPSSQN